MESLIFPSCPLCCVRVGSTPALLLYAIQTSAPTVSTASMDTKLPILISVRYDSIPLIKCGYLACLAFL